MAEPTDNPWPEVERLGKEAQKSLHGWAGPSVGVGFAIRELTAALVAIHWDQTRGVPK